MTTGVYRGGESSLSGVAASYLSTSSNATITGSWDFTGGLTINGSSPVVPTITGAAKGDVTVFNGTNWVNLNVGSDGQALVADSTQTDGVKWGTPSGGVSKYNTSVTTTTLATNAIDSQDFTHGLGLHPVLLIGLAAKGSVDDNFIISYSDSDGYSGTFYGAELGGFIYQGVSAPAAGKIRVTVKNRSTYNQTISYQLALVSI